MAAIEPTREATPALPATGAEQGRRSFAWSNWIVFALLILGLLVMVAPFVWMVLGSIKTQEELARTPPTWLPQAPTLDNYSRLFARLDFPRYFTNSAIIAVTITVGNLLFSSMLGYALAKQRFLGREKLFLLVLGTMMVPGAVTVIPLFVLMSRFNLVNTYWAVILPLIAQPFGAFLMRQFMLGIPDDLLDAGRIDGANEFYLFWRVALPISTPALAALGILTFMAAWNIFLWPLIVLTDDEMYTLPVALAVFAVGQHSADYGLLMAGALVIVVPVLVVFLFLQRYFTQGIAMTGLKG